MNNQTHKDDEVTLKELILNIQDICVELWNKKLWIIIICLPFVCFFAYKAINTPIQYEANIKFIVEGQGGGGGIGSLLGQFGFKSNSGKINPYQIIELANSKNTIQKIIFSPLNEDYLANEIIDEYELGKLWAKKTPELENFQFKSDSIEAFSRNEMKAFLRVIGKVLGPKSKPKEALQKVSLDEDTGIFSIYSKSESQDVSFGLIENTYQIIKDFYENKTLENKVRTRNLLKNKVDSLNSAMKSKYIQMARFEDRNRGLINPEKAAQRDILLGEIQAISMALGEAMKSFEISDYTLKDSQPLFMLVDKSLRPLAPLKASLVISIIKGLFLGAFLACLLIILMKIYREAMNS